MSFNSTNIHNATEIGTENFSFSRQQQQQQQQQQKQRQQQQQRQQRQQPIIVNSRNTNKKRRSASGGRSTWSVREDVFLLATVLYFRGYLKDEEVYKPRSKFWQVISDGIFKKYNTNRNKRQCKDRFNLLLWKKLVSKSLNFPDSDCNTYAYASVDNICYNDDSINIEFELNSLEDISHLTYEMCHNKINLLLECCYQIFSFDKSNNIVLKSAYDNTVATATTINDTPSSNNNAILSAPIITASPPGKHRSSFISQASRLNKNKNCSAMGNFDFVNESTATAVNNSKNNLIDDQTARSPYAVPTNPDYFAGNSEANTNYNNTMPFTASSLLDACNGSNSYSSKSNNLELNSLLDSITILKNKIEELSLIINRHDQQIHNISFMLDEKINNRETICGSTADRSNITKNDDTNKKNASKTLLNWRFNMAGATHFNKASNEIVIGNNNDGLSDGYHNNVDSKSINDDNLTNINYNYLNLPMYEPPKHSTYLSIFDPAFSREHLYTSSSN
ncbi:uncharacterized protein SCDLUD_000664 [Saccharomycodes ludwigii]|uniref:uncharacterized protein n=1 Tax=Saccharomycodes ludwigii TaxID=36035 RepID=UPI001E861A27|nr:hypothetical protein SCDLUD_000664 [Saccharomycodes ludwigii]KAH3903053.1 hypothetical protein SCDLUD_000664 [Saccharomycodes ludwigii]